MTRPCVTREELVDLFGEVDGRILARIVDTGATFDEVGEAVDSLERERKLGLRDTPSSLTVAAVRAILEELECGADQERVALLQGSPRPAP